MASIRPARAERIELHTAGDGANTCSSPPPALATAAPCLPPDNGLAECERVVRTYQDAAAARDRASLPAGAALVKIKGGELFKTDGHETFNAYVESRRFRDEVGVGLRRVQQLIAGAETADRLRGLGVTDLPRHEGQVRCLTGLPDRELVDAWQAVLDTVGSSASKAEVERAVGGAADAVQATTPTRAQGAPRADHRPLVAVTLATLTEGWPRDATRALKAVPRAHRPSLAATVARDFEPEHVTADIVAETADGYNASVMEDGAAPSSPEEILADPSDEPAPLAPGTTGAPIATLDILDAGTAQPDEAAVTCETTGGHAARRRSHRIFLGTAERRPTLVALPTGLIPAPLLDGVPDDVRKEGASEVVVEIGELERAGGPVEDGVIDLGTVFAFLAARELSYRLNRTNQHVDWARYTSNPLSGCWHLCRHVFCYAAGIARRQFAQGFLPTLYPARLKHFENTPLPDVSALSDDEAWRERSVFMVSMGDLFGGWVPEWYVEAVLDEVRRRPSGSCSSSRRTPRASTASSSRRTRPSGSR